MTVRAPEETHRTIVIGRTGTGKSQGAIDILSEQDWQSMPWVIIDYKGEDLIRDILVMSGWRKVKRKGVVYVEQTINSRIKELKFEDKIPRRPGLYYMHPRPKIDDEAMEQWLFKVHARGNIGLFIDEGYAMPKFGDSPAFTLILTQGRTLHIPVICLYQRPVWMSRFAVAQADFIRLFKQGDMRDKKVVGNYCPPATLPNGSKLGAAELDRLPDYYSLWHDVSRGITSVLLPAPSREAIMSKFRDRLVLRREGVLV